MKKNPLMLRSKILPIKSLSDEDFLKQLSLLSPGNELRIEGAILELFEHLAHDNPEQFQEYLAEEVPHDRLDLLVRQFKVWKASSRLGAKIETSEREDLKDLQWKLVVKTGGSDQASESVYVQMQLVVEADQRCRRHHLQMDVETFYDFLEKLEKGMDSVHEILHP